MEYKRGQAAMEYLMTYGWALLVIVLVLGALIYLGVLNPGARVQDNCNLPIGFKCEVASLRGDGTLSLKITNQQAITLYNVQVGCITGTGIETKAVTGTKADLAPGSSANLNCKLEGFTGKQIGEIANGEVMLGYSEVPGEITKYVKGTYAAKVSVPA